MQLHTPASQDVSLRSGERIKVDSIPPVLVSIRPVIKSSDFDEHTYGHTNNLNPAISAAVAESIKAFSSSNRLEALSRNGSRGCIERVLASRETYWTLEDPGHYACKTCFNRKQPCMRSMGKHKWIILPLPPNLRNPDVAWQDKAYYIHPYEETSLRYPGIWRIEPHKGKGIKREPTATIGEQASVDSPYAA